MVRYWPERQGAPVSAPNLDAMSHDELAHFHRRYRLAGARKSADLLELGHDTPPGYVAVARSLASYASQKRAAMRCRLNGNIGSALILEAMCEARYDALPDYARW